MRKMIHKCLNGQTLVSTLAGLLLMLSMLPTALRAESGEDSTFLAEAHKVIFLVNSTVISSNDRARLIREVVPSLKSLGPRGVVVVRSAASPEGPYENNKRLAIGRREAIKTIFENQGVENFRIQYVVADEEYDLLVEMMRQRGDADYPMVAAVVDSLHDDCPALKAALQSVRGGALFARLQREYFAELRAVRVLIRESLGIPAPTVFDSVVQEACNVAALQHLDYSFAATPASQPVTRSPRRELLAVKTNLAEYAAYVPKYGWCPMPNVSLEYYPRHGHWTLGASFDCPWYEGNIVSHKYFELRNYTLDTRYYFRSSDRSYDDQGRPTGHTAFSGFYLQAYGHVFLYQIGCNADDGWIGEGGGGGLGLGYVIPLGRNYQRWRLDIGAMGGYLRTKYDPFVYGCPVDGTTDGRYYYKYTGEAKYFRERQYRFTWIGPTRVWLSLSYDLFYRRNDRRGIGLRRSEQKGGDL